MKLPKPEDLQPLLQLTKVREQAAMAELGRVAAARNAAADRVAELKAQAPQAQGISDAAVLAKWLLWRDQELHIRQGELARCMADYARCLTP